MADTFDGNYILGVLPEDFKEELLDDVIFIELELSDMGRNDLDTDPNRGIDLARHYSKQGEPIILLGLREYTEISGWEELVQRKNVYFLKKAGLTREKLIKAIKEVTEK